MTDLTARQQGALDAQGARAGFVSRLGANTVDGVLIELLWVAILATIALYRYLLSHETLHLPRPAPSVTILTNAGLALLYLTFGWAGEGRTVGKTLFGLRVVGPGGARVGVLRAAARAALCLALPVVMLGWVLFSRRNLGVHDLIVRTHVAYDWSRPAVLAAGKSTST